MVHPEVKNWIKYARFEEKHGYIAHGRKVYERAVEFFGEDHIEENLFVAFAKFEEAQKEVRARRREAASCWREPELASLGGFCERRNISLTVFVHSLNGLV